MITYFRRHGSYELDPDPRLRISLIIRSYRKSEWKPPPPREQKDPAPPRRVCGRTTVLLLMYDKTTKFQASYFYMIVRNVDAFCIHT